MCGKSDIAFNVCRQSGRTPAGNLSGTCPRLEGSGKSWAPPPMEEKDNVEWQSTSQDGKMGAIWGQLIQMYEQKVGPVQLSSRTGVGATVCLIELDQQTSEVVQ